mmetsp:Transcript_9586/g.28620  ORF Transcript_9586/g.28620 Transcript_9586/m.28620 type:complete len:118 (+) Transcript_9586:862-1215(+)
MYSGGNDRRSLQKKSSSRRVAVQSYAFSVDRYLFQGMEPKSGRHHHIDGDASSTYQPVGGSSLQHGGYHNDGKKNANSFVGVKVEGHGPIHHPTDDDAPWQHQRSHLDGAAYRHTYT